MSPLYIRTILKDVSASLYIQRILAIASSGREREARSSSKATKFGGPPGENVLPYKSDRGARGKNFKNTPKMYENLVLRACSKFISTPNRYQFNNNNLYNWHCKINSNKNNFRTLSSHGVF